MALSPRLIALQGLGGSPRLVAVQGLWPSLRDSGGSARRRYALPTGWADDEDDMLLLFAVAAAAHYGVLQ